MLTSKQRAFLRSMANSIDTIVMVGKGGITTKIIKQVTDALRARELIKGKVLETSGIEVRDCADEISSQVAADVVQVIGTKFVLYKKNYKESKISIPK